jgi:hypothetical protein
MAPEPGMRPVRMIPVGVLRTLCLPTNMSAPVPFASLIRVTPVQPGPSRSRWISPPQEAKRASVGGWNLQVDWDCVDYLTVSVEEFGCAASF